MNRLSAVGDRAKGVLAGFTVGQRAVVLVAVLALALGAVALSRWAAQPSWSPLFTNLSITDASAIVEQLHSDGVQYKLGNGGTTILVPQAQVYEVRVSLAGKGLTDGGDESGYSVLDKQGMTATDFQQNVALQRAMEAELNRTLKAISGVKTAIVHLAIPKKDVFTTEEDKTTASVLLDLAPGTTLGRAQIRSVMHLVAGSVPGLDPSDVTVSDADGNMLSVREDGAEGSAGAAGETDQQTQQFEDAKSSAVQKMLDSVLGQGRSVVRVNAELNFDTSSTTSRSYPTATGIPLSEATSKESYGPGAAATGGVLGQTWPSLTPGVNGNGGGSYLKEQRTVNNAVGEVVNETTAAPGAVKRMTVAVVLDATKAGAVDPARIQSLVANAVGLDAKRGDTVQVERLAFDTAAADTAKKELARAQSAAKTSQYVDLGKKAGLGLLLVILALVFLRRKRSADAQVEAIARDLPAPTPPGILGAATGEQLAISAAAVDALGIADSNVLDPTLERERLRDEVAQFVDNQPEEIAAIVQGWLGQRKG